MVATLVSLDRQEKITPGTSLSPASNARAMNCCRAPALMLAEGGETSMREIAGVQATKLAPLIWVPGLKARAPPLAVRCGAKLPLISGERVTDWLLSASIALEPPYATSLTIAPARSCNETIPPEFTNERLPVDALITPAPPKAGSFGLKAALPPPNTTIELHEGRIVPAAKTWRSVSKPVPREKSR